MPTAFAIAAHHDDIEFLMAGTLLQLRAVGWQLHYMNLASGNCGTVEYDAATIVRIRREEAKAAAAKLGATFHDSLVNDLEILYELPTLRRLAAVVRDVSPDIVLTHAPADYMEDHMNACRLAVTAAFVRGMPNFESDPPRPQVSGKVTVYHAQPYGNCDPLGNVVRPGIFVDTSPHLEIQTAALAEHRSQKDWLDKSQGLDSYLHKMHELAREVGKMSGRYEYAEGWRKHLHLGFCGAEDDPLSDALSKCSFSQCTPHAPS
jgi:LmbE family N-acetylglucosaminyl deacetylase